jgi:flagellar L-ring protein precursor FlgH
LGIKLAVVGVKNKAFYMKFYSYLLSLAAIIMISGCSHHPMDPEIELKPPKYVEQIPAKESEAPPPSMGSLFGSGEAPLFSDRKAMNVNDVVRVTISESATSSSSGKKALAKSDAATLGGGVVTSPNGKINPVLKTAGKLADSLMDVGLTANSGYTFSGSGSNARTETFKTTISARIIKVMPNNTYFIDGSRELLIDGEKQLIRVSGVIRGDDIGQTNTIDSTYISDAKIWYETQGDISRASNQGWASKAIEAVWPF